MTYIPTIAELLGRPERELTAIYRKAVAIAGDEKKPEATRRAAAKTAENVRHCLPKPSAP